MADEKGKEEQVRCAHILVKTKSEALDIIEQVKSGAVSFEEMAMQHSLCPSKRVGGDLGKFGRGKMVKEFEQAAFGLKKGEMSEPVLTEFGWHVIKRIS